MSNQKLSKQLGAQVEDAQVARSSDENALRASADTRGIARKGLWVLGLGFGGFLLWASLAPLDEGVPSMGTVAIDTKRKAVQHLSGGIVKEVLVREGDEVKADQVLMRLDSAVSRANFESVRQRYVGLSAMQSRLQAEQQGLAKITFQPEVLEAMSDPEILAQVNNQRQLFESRKQALKAELQSMQESVKGLKAQREASQEVLLERQKQLLLVKDELANIRELVKDGYAPRNRQSELERMQADTQASIAELSGAVLRATSSMAELNQRMLARQSEYRKEVETQLADVAREVQADAEKYVAQKQDLQRVDIRSPAAGHVMGLAVQTVGAVVQPGQKLMDVVPQEQDLLLEAHIAPHLIDKISVGLLADIRFNTFAHSPQLVVEGKVLSISGDLVTDPQNPQVSHFLARLQVTPEGKKTLGARQLQPGMPAEIVIKTGERSMLKYLLNPLLKRMAGAMKEE
ncbi:secretion protein HlyD [Limnohabitans sp. 2KL-1]|uniref:HlyD family type I secretion periplasmic adaptor subunit n=1 Tax=Limnohabitans sp. 2KL-1 TaxID=1100699 RepID=UPI000D369D6A|nr:HlyD family type I secretion periplasmic adaptor subunit [Limnohabitans sp. 2KL-1]PUE50684.1 secretion protein HlyD [Limnohabitans sp. 2KL-1]